jgi:hypothetical protein
VGEGMVVTEMRRLPNQLKRWFAALEKGGTTNAARKKLDEYLLALVRYYIRGDREQRHVLFEHVSNAVADQLLLFGHQAAEESVQSDDQNRLIEGLAALALGIDKIDLRDMIMVFSLLAHSAEKMNWPFNHLFEKTMVFGEGQFENQIKAFLARDDEDRSIYEMGYKESVENKVFKYVRHLDF